jgi:hypothetical protein
MYIFITIIRQNYNGIFFIDGQQYSAAMIATGFIVSSLLIGVTSLLENNNKNENLLKQFSFDTVGKVKM